MKVTLSIDRQAACRATERSLSRKRKRDILFAKYIYTNHDFVRNNDILLYIAALHVLYRQSLCAGHHLGTLLDQFFNLWHQIILSVCSVTVCTNLQIISPIIVYLMFLICGKCRFLFVSIKYIIAPSMFLFKIKELTTIQC